MSIVVKRFAETFIDSVTADKSHELFKGMSLKFLTLCLVLKENLWVIKVGRRLARISCGFEDVN